MNNEQFNILIELNGHDEYYLKSNSIPRIGEKIRVYNWTSSKDFLVKDVIYKSYEEGILSEDVILIVE